MEFQISRKTFPRVLKNLSLLGVFTALATAQPVFADGCADLGGIVSAGECLLTAPVTQSGTFTITQTLHLSGAGRITVPPAANGNALTLNVEGDFIMDSGTTIQGDVAGTNAAEGTGATIVIAASGDILLWSDAAITAKQTGALCSGGLQGGKGGNITLRADGNISTESGSELRVDARCPAGEIIIAAGAEAFIDGIVSSESGHTGTGATQRPGGGPITIIAACHATIADNAFVSSRGKDPGADLVHIEGGCRVDIFGYVESTSGHGQPNSPANHCSTNRPHSGLSEDPTGCIEIWSGGPLFIDRRSHQGELSTDPIRRGGVGSAWIDLFAVKDISISGPSAGNGPDCNTSSPYAIHTNQLCQNNATGGVVTVKSKAGSVLVTGKAVQASAGDQQHGGGDGGQIIVEAKSDVQLDKAELAAQGDFNPAGGLGSGGKIEARAFNGVLQWQGGVGDARPDGVTNLQGCATVDISGAFFPATAPKTQTDSCGGAPQLPGYVTLPQCDCYKLSVTKTCSAAIASTGTKVEVRFSGLVKNTGRLPLYGVSIVDEPQAPFSQLPPSILLRGEEASFAGSYEMTTIPANGFSDTVTVTAYGASGGAPLTESAAATCAVTPQTTVTVTKQCTNPTTPLGQPVKFHGEVCNTGTEQVTNVTVTDTPPAKSIVLDKTVLAPKECAKYQGEYETARTGTQKDAVTAQGTGKLSGVTAVSLPAVAECTVVSWQPKLSVEANGVCTGGQSETSSTVELSGQVCNKGDEDLKEIKVVSTKPQTNTQLSFPSTLAKGQCAPFKQTYPTTTLADSALVTVVAVGVSSGLSVNAQDDASYSCPPPSVQIPKLTVTTECRYPANKLGTPTYYSGEICNVGGETLTALSLTSDRPKANTPVKLSKTTLGKDQCLPYQGSYKLPGSGLITHSVTASALSSSGGLLEKASASATCAIGQSCSPANWIGLGLMNGWYKYKSNQKVGAIFAGAKTSDFTALAKLTLFQALRGNNQKSALQNAAAQLIKEAVGALLNAAHPNVGYPLKDPQSIITQVNAALTSKDVPTIKALTQTLKTYNLLGGAPAICEVNPPC